tara:strand:+ start:8697 stop:8930 length:234 start_codon:yes stop_codon:yes gene_type:complete
MVHNQRGRAYRRHQYERLKRKRVRNAYWGVGIWRTDENWTPGMLGIAVDTPTPHSCPYPRDTHRQELRANVASKDKE